MCSFYACRFPPNRDPHLRGWISPGWLLRQLPGVAPQQAVGEARQRQEGLRGAVAVGREATSGRSGRGAGERRDRGNWEETTRKMGCQEETWEFESFQPEKW